MAEAKNPEDRDREVSLPSGITQLPTQEEFQLGETEIRQLEELFDWQERSQKTHWVLGQPLGVQPA
jgi:hypothetical protein